MKKIKNIMGSVPILMDTESVITDPPELVEITLHNTCNYKCKMCYFWALKQKDSIPYDLLINAIDEVAKLNTVNPKLQLLGGETLMYPKIDQAINHASKLGIEIEIVTNGYFLNQSMVKKLSNAGLKGLTLSLDSIDKNIHNFLRGIDCYDKVIDAIELLTKFAPEIRLSINTIISEINMHTLTKTAKFVNNKKGITSMYFIALEKPYNSGFDDAWRTNSPVSYLWPTNKTKVDEVFNSLIKEKKINKKIGNSLTQFEVYRKYYHNHDIPIKKNGCDFGSHHLRVNQDGNVYLCSERDDIESIGSIKSKSLTEIWKSRKAYNTRNVMHGCKKNCVQILSCGYKDE